MVWNGRRFFRIPFGQFFSIPFPFHTKNLPFHTKIFFHIPVLAKILVEASHANAHARAIAFFPYIWFKYDILSYHCCKLRSVVVLTLHYQPSAPGFNSRIGGERVMQYAGIGKEMHYAIFFLLQYLDLQLGLGQGCLHVPFHTSLPM